MFKANNKNTRTTSPVSEPLFNKDAGLRPIIKVSTYILSLHLL